MSAISTYACNLLTSQQPVALQVPEMSAFFLLSIFPQLPIVLVLSFAQRAFGEYMPLDLAMGILATLFIVSNVVVQHSEVAVVMNIIFAGAGAAF